MTPLTQAQDMWATPFELSDGNETATWSECIEFHQRLALAFPQWLRIQEIGRSDGGAPIHLGTFSLRGIFDAELAKASACNVFFNNNGIHPGEPEGIDACMALVRDLCTDPERHAPLHDTVLIFIPIYNVDGALNRQNTSRVNQNGPEMYGFRGSARHLDLNRDFIKSDSSSTRVFAGVFARWDPDVMVDTHTSNGADYQHVVTLIATQPDKLGGRTGEHLRDLMLPAVYADMTRRGFPLCPYVNPVLEIPDDGIVDFLDSPRYSTGYAALHQTIGFMPETHMLKPFAQRYDGTLAFLESALTYTAANGSAIRTARAADRGALAEAGPVAVAWELDKSRNTTFDFSGFTAHREPSRLGNYERLRYEVTEPWKRPVSYFNIYRVSSSVVPPIAYLLPQAWPEVAARLEAHGVRLRRATRPLLLQAEAYSIDRFKKSPLPFEGRHLHGDLTVSSQPMVAQIAEGDWIVPLDGPLRRFVVEVLEPASSDSFFQWGFFDSVLDKKETFSDYVFEDEAERLLQDEPDLKRHFEGWKVEHPHLLNDSQAVLNFLFLASRRYAEPEWRRYPVLRLLESPEAAFGEG